MSRANRKAAAEQAFGIQWEYRWNNSDDAQVTKARPTDGRTPGTRSRAAAPHPMQKHGPFTSTQMAAWKGAGYFTGDMTCYARQVRWWEEMDGPKSLVGLTLLLLPGGRGG